MNFLNSIYFNITGWTPINRYHILNVKYWEVLQDDYQSLQRYLSVIWTVEFIFHHSTIVHICKGAENLCKRGIRFNCGKRRGFKSSSHALNFFPHRTSESSWKFNSFLRRMRPGSRCPRVGPACTWQRQLVVVIRRSLRRPLQRLPFNTSLPPRFRRISTGFPGEWKWRMTETITFIAENPADHSAHCCCLPRNILHRINFLIHSKMTSCLAV